MTRSQGRPSNGSSLRVPDYLALAAVFISTLAVHIISPVTTSTDSAWTFHVAASILREGNVDLDEYRHLTDPAEDYRLRVIGAHIYYYYPAATPLLVTPAVLLANALLPLRGSADLYSYLDANPPDDRTARLEKLVASFIVAAAAATIYLLARRFGGTGNAIALALVFAFGTSMWSTASRALWQHGPSVLLLSIALFITIAAPEKPLCAFAAGAILAFAYLVRPTNSVSFAFFGLYHLFNNRRRLLAYALGGLLVLLPYVLYNLTATGSVLPPYSFQLFERIGTPPLVLEALVGTLVSPNRGLLIFTPVFIFTGYGIYRQWTLGHFAKANLEPYVLGILVTHWVTTSFFEDWGGAWSIGPRYFVDVIPYLMYFLIPVFASPVVSHPVWKYVLIGTVIAGMLVQLHCSISIYPFMWNGKPQALVDAPERKWDWGDLQFLRGLCRNDPLEGRAPACWITPGD